MLMRPVAMRTYRILMMVACVVLVGSVMPASANNYSNNMTYSIPFLQSSGGYLPFLGSGMLPGFASGYLPFGVRNALTRPYNYSPNNQPPSGQQSSSFAGSPANGKPMLQEPYADPEPVGDPRQRVRAFRVEKGFGVHDQVAYARKRVPDSTPPQAVPQAAPDHSHHLSVPPVAQAGKHSSPEAAANFIDSVNNKYNGDIKQALFDPETRASAKSIGLIDEDGLFDANFSPARVDTMRGILRDSSLDPQSKVGALKFLLPAQSSQ